MKSLFTRARALLALPLALLLFASFIEASVAADPPRLQAPKPAAPAVAAADPYADDYAATAGVVLFAIDDKVQAVVLISKKGQDVTFSAKECAADAECSEIVTRLIHDGKADLLNIRTGTQI